MHTAGGLHDAGQVPDGHGPAADALHHGGAQHLLAGRVRPRVPHAGAAAAAALQRALRPRPVRVLPAVPDGPAAVAVGAPAQLPPAVLLAPGPGPPPRHGGQPRRAVQQDQAGGGSVQDLARCSEQGEAVCPRLRPLPVLHRLVPPLPGPAAQADHRGPGVPLRERDPAGAGGRGVLAAAGQPRAAVLRLLLRLPQLAAGGARHTPRQRELDPGPRQAQLQLPPAGRVLPHGEPEIALEICGLQFSIWKVWKQ